jgi:hypothetical protein
MAADDNDRYCIRRVQPRSKSWQVWDRREKRFADVVVASGLQAEAAHVARQMSVAERGGQRTIVGPIQARAAVRLAAHVGDQARGLARALAANDLVAAGTLLAQVRAEVKSLGDMLERATKVATGA